MAKDTRCDEDLVSSFLAGEPAALEQLLDRYQEYIWRYALRLSHYKDEPFIDDIRQQVLVTIFKDLKAGAFKPSGQGSFRAWVHLIIRHRCIKANERFRRQPEPISQLFPDEMPDIPDERITEPDEDAIKDDRVERVLARLNDEERLLLRLMAENKSYQEMQEVEQFTKYTPANLRQKTCRLRKYLIQLYKNKT